MVSTQVAAENAPRVDTLNDIFPLDKLSFTRAGDKNSPAVLVLHGWGSSAAIMSPIADHLSHSFETFNLDLPGHGNTPPPVGAIGVPEYAAIVHRFITEIIGRPVSIVGHSNGGRIGLFLASEPGLKESIISLALISPSGIKPRRGLTYYLKTGIAKALKAPFVKLPEPLRSHGLRWVRGTHVWQMLGSSDYKSVTGVMRDVFIRTVGFFVDDRLADISCPVLLQRGSEDTAVSEYQMRTLDSGISNSRYIVLPGAGHYAFIDEPSTVFTSVTEFLSSTQ